MDKNLTDIQKLTRILEDACKQQGYGLTNWESIATQIFKRGYKFTDNQDEINRIRHDLKRIARITSKLIKSLDILEKDVTNHLTPKKGV